MSFFWRQPTYQSDLDHLLVQLAEGDPSLPARKEAGLKRLWDKPPFDGDDFGPDNPSLRPQPANPFR